MRSFFLSNPASLFFCLAVFLLGSFSFVFGLGKGFQMFAWQFATFLFLCLSFTWPAKRRILFGFACLFLVIGVFDFSLKGFLNQTFETNLTSSYVTLALANTHKSESLQFFQQYFFEISVWAMIFIAMLAISGILIYHLYNLKINKHNRFLQFGIFLLLVLIAISWISNPWRRNLPPMQWAKVFSNVSKLQNEWKEVIADQESEQKTASQCIKGFSDKKQTIVLVIGESTNRDNMGIYGYVRNTTPLLDLAIKNQNLEKISEGWSIHPSTVSAFHSMFSFPTFNDPSGESGNLFAFFRFAGWEITWISNQDDIAISSEYMGWANRTIRLNKEIGRSSDNLDEEVLPYLKEALAGSAQKKLIIVHLIGIHPHYKFRFSDEFSSAWRFTDQITEKLSKLSRSSRTIEARNDYDRGMLYQDKVIAESLVLTQEFSYDCPALWIYLSDHGQETGDTLNRTGHSPNTLSGYKIPVLFWANDLFLEKEGFDLKRVKHFRADWLSETLFDAADISRVKEYPQKSIFEKGYLFQVPEILHQIKDSPFYNAEKSSNP